LSDFIENWCLGMENDELLVSSEFDRIMFGFASEPMKLIIELISELKSTGKDLNFKNLKEL
jgi:hypothetical protein